MDAIVAELQREHCRLRKSAQYRDSDEQPSLLLGAVNESALAQIMSFHRGAALSTLAAVSPSMRLYSEVASNGRKRVNLNVPLSTDTLVHELQYNFRALQPVPNISWWLERCPLSLRAKDAEALAQLMKAPQPVLDKLTSLVIGKKNAAASVPVEVLLQLEELCVPGDAAALRAVDPGMLTKLRTLRVYQCSEETFAVVCRMPALRHLFIEGLEVCMPSMHAVASAPCLEQLTVVTSTLEGISGFDACTSLRHVRFNYCSAIDALTSLAAAPQLRTVHCQSIGVSRLKGMAMCPQLESLELSSCKSLRRLSPVAGSATIRVISVEGCDVDDISGLATCVLLERLNLNGCQNLATLAPLAGAPRLRELFAAGTNVRNLSGLANCPFLQVLDVSYCDALTSLASLAGSPQLQRIVAANSGVSDIDGLSTCPELISVDFTGCVNLLSLAPVAGSRSLRTILARRSGVRNIDQIGTCPELESVDFKYCKGLHTLAPLVGAAKLSLIVAAQKYVAEMECPCELLQLIKEQA